MKPQNLFLLPAVLLIWLSCGPKTTAPVNKPSATAASGCKDTTGTFSFSNGSSMEVKLHLLSQQSTREGNTIINTWLKYKQFTVKSGDSVLVKLSSNRKFMYDIYGPVSTNINGQGIVSTGKIQVKPCEVLYFRYTE